MRFFAESLALTDFVMTFDGVDCSESGGSSSAGVTIGWMGTIEILFSASPACECIR